MNPAITLYDSPLSPVEFNELRTSVGWRPLDPDQIRRAFAASLFIVHARDQERVVACGRIVGDGSIYFYVQDMIVLPGYQKQGIGTAMLKALVNFVDTDRTDPYFLGLMAAEGMAPFYERNNIPLRKANAPGMGRWFKVPDAANGG